MSYFFHLVFAGIWAMVWHWGIGVAIIIFCLIGALATQLFAGIPLIGPWLVRILGPLRTDLLWAAAVVAGFLVGMAVGAHDATVRCNQRTEIITHHINDIVEGTKTPKSQQDKDPYDSPNN